jgi:hypothetical protein
MLARVGPDPATPHCRFGGLPVSSGKVGGGGDDDAAGPADDADDGGSGAEDEGGDGADDKAVEDFLDAHDADDAMEGDEVDAEAEAMTPASVGPDGFPKHDLDLHLTGAFKKLLDTVVSENDLAFMEERVSADTISKSIESEVIDSGGETAGFVAGLVQEHVEELEDLEAKIDSVSHEDYYCQKIPQTGAIPIKCT